MMRVFAVIAVLAAFVLSTQLLAQEEEETKLTSMQKMKLQQLKWQLKLTEEQVEKVKTLMLEEGKRTKEQIKGLLDEDQKEAYEEMGRGRGFGGPGVRFGGGPGGGSRAASVSRESARADPTASRSRRWTRNWTSRKRRRPRSRRSSRNTGKSGKKP
ncbi:MAG: hypothetical protein ACYTFG_20145 [Planctomycetota bacterium]